MDSNLVEEIYKRIDLPDIFIKISKTSIHKNEHKGNEEQVKEHEKFRNKLISNLLKEQCKKEDVEDIKLFNLAISLGSLKYMYIYYYKITELNKEIDKDTMDKFINRVINTKNIQYIFLVFTQVLKNDSTNFYKYSYKLLNVIFNSKDSYLLSIIFNNYEDILSPALRAILTTGLITIYNITQDDCQFYFEELQCDLLNNDDTNANHNFKENSRNCITAQSPPRR